MDSASTGDRPIHVSWERAAPTILGLALELQREHVVVGITGPVGAGKSTLAAAITDCVLATDDFLPDHDATAREQSDSPAASDARGARSAIARLRDGETIDVPVWSFQEHKRVGTRHMASGEVIVCEGIHALEPRLADLIDIRVFVDAPSELRWRRWESMAISGERGWDVAQSRDYFNEVAEPTFAVRAAALRASSHVVVQNP